MLTHLRRRRLLGRVGQVGLAAIATVATVASFSCDKMPLLAPTGATISLYATSSVLAPNGSLDLIATVVEQGSGGGTGTAGAATPSTGGQPVHNGTLVTFTTSIGTITPSEARTNNGQVTVKLTGDGRSGVASIFAYSGSAKSAELKINVGAAAVERVVLTATPQSLPPAGGTAELAARVEDISGNALVGVDVTFSTTAGTIQTPTVKTDSTGVGRASLVTSQAAKVTASSGAKTATIDVALAPRSGVNITPPATSPSAGSPANFTVTVSGSANVREVVVSWGDGTATSLGAISGSTNVTHTYTREGAYNVTATATDAAGNRESMSTSITVLQAAPVAVTVTASPTSPTTGQTVTFTATATAPTGFSIARYDWNFGDNSGTSTSGGSASHVYSVIGPQTVTVTAVATNGVSGTGQTIVTVTAQTPVAVTLTASSTSPAINQLVTFTATTGALPSGAVITGYSWNFGDGVTQSTGGNTVTHAFTSIGPKDITVTVSLSNGGGGTGLTTVIVTNPPPVTVVLSANPPNPTAGATVTFTATIGSLPAGVTVTNYVFNFGDGVSVTVTSNITTHIYATAGVKTVLVTVNLSNGTTAVGQTTVNQQ